RRSDLVDRTIAKERLQVAFQIASVVLNGGGLSLHHVLEVVDVALSNLPERVPIGFGNDDVAVHPPAQLTLGLVAREARPRARRPLLPDLSLNPARAYSPRAIPGFAPVPVPVGEQA